MRASDLLGREVVDADGHPIGRVHDLRSTLDRSAIGGARGIPISHLIVGPRWMGGRLGYSHGDVKGPWLLRSTLRLAARRARIIRAEDIGALGLTIRLDVARSALRHPQDQP